MKEIRADEKLVAYCGLYCGACKRYLQEKCSGCPGFDKATWCKIRTCCQKNRFSTCAECREHPDPMACRQFNNLVSKLFALLFRSDRAACIDQIKRLGLSGHAERMSQLKHQTLRK